MVESSVGKAKKKYPGTYQAKVVSTEDPEGFMRVQVSVYGLFKDVPKKDLSWAEYLLPIGFRPNDGFFVPADVGDIVIVDFPYNGDSRRPRILGSAHFCPDGKPNMPDEAWGGPDSYEHKRTSPQLTPTAAAYHRDVVLAQHGILIEIVSGTSEVRVTQKKTGSAAEFDKDGNITAHSEKNLYGSSVENTEFDVGKDLKARVAGTIDITSPLTTINGALRVTGPITSVGGISGEGGITTTTINASGTITAPYLDGVAREADDN